MPYVIPQEDIVSKQSLSFLTDKVYQGHRLHYASVSGVATTGIKGDSASSWKRDKVKILVPRPIIPVSGTLPGSGPHQATLQATEWTIHAGLNAIFNKHHGDNSGHAVDAYRLLNADSFTNTLELECDIAVRDIDAYLYRIGFKIDLMMYQTGVTPLEVSADI